MSEASDQITEYLSVGGLFNPEIMNQTQHEAVRDTLIKARGDIQQLERENAALLDLIQDMAYQHCHTGVAIRDYNGQVAGTMVTDSGALTANGEALRRLAEAKPPRFRIVAEHGRMVVGYWPENDPQKEAQP